MASTSFALAVFGYAPGQRPVPDEKVVGGRLAGMKSRLFWLLELGPLSYGVTTVYAFSIAGLP